MFKNIKVEEVLYSFLFPTFIVGQFFFKLNILIIILFVLLKFNKDILNYKFTEIQLIFFIFILYLVFNSVLISKLNYSSNTRYLFYLSLILFYICTRYLIIKNKINFINILKIGFVTILFVYLDSLIQFIYKKDIFGYNYNFHYKRYPGPFGDEWILGYFISFTSILFSYIFFFKNKIKNKSYEILFYFYLILSVYICLKSGERMAFFTFVIQVASVIFFVNIKNLKKIIFFIFALILLFVSSIVFDKDIKQKYSNFYKLVFNYEENYIQSSKSSLSNDEISKLKFNKITFFNTQTGAHFLTAIEVWKKYPILGIGIKNFRYESKKEIYSKINSQQFNHRSATHPHNIYLEILSETGLVGLILMMYLFYLVFKNSLKEIFKSEETDIMIIILFSIFISKIFPFKADPSILGSSLGSWFWINFIFLISYLEKRKFINV